MIPLSVPCLRGNEWRYVKECLDTEWVSSAGTYVDAFERKIGEYTGATHAVACVNGTSALHVALQIAGVRPGDAVLVPTVTFIAPVNAIRYLGAEPVFMDCDDYYNIDVEKTAEFLRRETVQRKGAAFDRESGRRIAAVVPVHVYGNAARLWELREICAERAVRIVEDASESLGTVYTDGPLAGRHTGTVGDLGCFSFNGNKIITCGGGGMIVTNDPESAARAKYLTTQAKDDEIRYVHEEVGYNYRLTNVLAALGVAQLEQLPAFLDIKRKQFAWYRQEIGAIPGLSVADPPPYASNNHWMHCLRIDVRKYGLDREELMRRLAERGIQTRPVWRLNHWQRPYAACRGYRIERAPTLYEQTLNIPSSVNLTEDQSQAVVEALRR